MPPAASLYIGLMSGTSLDGVDGALAAFPGADGRPVTMLATAYIPFDEDLRAALMGLQHNGPDEIHREALAAVQLAVHYAECVAALRRQHPDAQIAAVGVHGQTIRHRPELGYTRQTNNPALLAELTRLDVVADFRSRDVAAGGQGAPLACGFHHAMFGDARQTRAVVNIGGIGNITVLPAGAAHTIGFDTGPGNALMDAWIGRHLHKPYDENGAWAAAGTIRPALLSALKDEAYFRLPAPKSTGRDLFHMDWLDRKLAPFADLPAIDVQATLAALTADSIAQAIAAYAPEVADVYVCGGGAYNAHLMRRLEHSLRSALPSGQAPAVQSTTALGVAPNQVEALAFAWLAQRFTQRLPGNLPTVTGATGSRVLGALYPA
jgi:anhydro-N-acetylmuramic acid kinase